MFARQDHNRFALLLLTLLGLALAFDHAPAAARSHHRAVGIGYDHYDAKSAASDIELCDHSLANPQTAIPACTRLIEHSGDGADAAGFYNNRGLGEIGVGDLNSAVADFTDALARKPGFIDALKNRGIAYQNLGRYDDALADFNRALQLDDKQAAIYNGRGTVLFRKDQFDLAIADYDKALALDGHYAKAYVNRGQAFAAKRQFDRAIADFDAFINLAPNEPAGYINRGDAHKEMGEFEAAIVDYDKVIELSPRDWEAYTHRGEAKRLRGDLPGSLADHDKAIEINRNAKEAYVNRALALKDEGRYPEGEQSCGKAIVLDPKYSPAYLNRGLIRRLSGNLRGSLDDLDKAVSLDPLFHLALSFRGDTRRELGDTAGALSDFTEALGLWPQSVPAYVGRGETYAKIGDVTKAKADLTKALSLTPTPDGFAKPAQEFARKELAALASQLVVAQQPSKDARTAEQQAIKQGNDELNRLKDELDRTRKVDAEAADKLKKQIDSLQNELQRAQAELDRRPAEVIPDQGTRVALVIGNSQYGDVPFLPNPQRDAQAVADTFRKLGFQTVITQTNLTLRQMRTALNEFEERVKQGVDWAVIYYAGHGLEVAGVKYLVPVDAKLSGVADVTYEAVPLDHLLLAAQSAKKLHVVILDMCRNNPFVTRLASASRSVSRGFSRVEPKGGELVAFSAGEGQTAEDGDGEHSPFTQAFLKNVTQPGVEINYLFRKVRADVKIATQGKQEPATYDGLSDDLFYFATK